jgi:D-alanyl-D-alanine carboxypeptidase/D-alanyl-D-alanine-endopeptidase (penicillin-binding protein 4)
MKKILALFFSFAISPAGFADSLPGPVIEALARAHIPLGSVGVVVQEERASSPLLSVNANVAMNPASTMKLLTTLSALETLGPAYRWKTEAYLDGKLEHGVLQGNLVFKGYGDPKFTVEQFWLWLHELRQRGLREIRGDIVLDHSFFAPMNHDSAEFDNDPTRAYNVGPSALLLNFNALHLHLIPDGKNAIALLEPDLANYTVSNRIVTSAKLPCHGADAYSARLDGHTIVLEGAIPEGCGEADDYFSLLSHDDYFFAVFGALWQGLGGTLQGKVREGSAPVGQAAFATHVSPELSEVVRDINKFSNNIMARQLFLTMGAVDGQPADIAHSIAFVQQWLLKQELQFPELVMENGAGLSRKARISARHLADVLQRATRGLYSAELQASLPILGLDGTVKKRFKDGVLAGHAHLKTGTLEGVKSIAGYVHAQSGKQWIVVLIINHPNAASGQAAQDALIEWVQKSY